MNTISFFLSSDPIDEIHVSKKGFVEIKSDVISTHRKFKSLYLYEKYIGMPIEDLYPVNMTREIKKFLGYVLYRCPKGGFYERRGDYYLKVGEISKTKLPKKSKKVSWCLHPIKD
jgi:hypothetical protein